MKLIKTFDGTMAPQNKCRRILKAYYEENRQCFLMPDGKWHRINNGKIFFNHETKEYQLGTNRMINGIVGFEKDGTLKFGYFTPKVAKNVRVDVDGYNYYCLTRKIIETTDYVENIGDGIFYQEKIDRGERDQKRIRDGYSQRLNYRCGYRLKETTEAFNQYFKGKNFVHQFYKLLPEITFGIEYETATGRVAEDLMLQNGLIPVKDGSLRKNGYEPFEYATIIHNGESGLKAVIEQCKLLRHYCETGMECSTHIHIGNIPLTKEFVTSMFIVGNKIQDELYAMFPKYYRTTSKFKNSGTDYCNPLSNLPFTSNKDTNFNLVFNEVLGSGNYNFHGFGMGHPNDVDETRKWQVHSRYKIINLVPTIFSKSGTVEYRIHGPSFNHDKIINWLFIISAVTKFAEKYSDKLSVNDTSFIKTISLKSIIQNMYGESILTSYLNAYIEYRKNLIKIDNLNGDYIGKRDLAEDNIDKFDFNIKSLVLQHE